MKAPPESAPTGVLGGTFDPVHHGHLRLAESAREQLRLASVLWVPAGRPPHRVAPHAAAGHRLEMVRIAIAGHPGFALDEAEAAAPEPSYTVATLERLRRARGSQHPLVLLLGVDAFLGLPAWHRWRELFDLAHVAVANRPGYPLQSRELPDALAAEVLPRERNSAEALHTAAAGTVCAFEMTPLAISATAIRADLATGRSARYLLPDSVLDYIRRNRLYTAAMDGL